jgi:hypothetical protein
VAAQPPCLGPESGLTSISELLFEEHGGFELDLNATICMLSGYSLVYMKRFPLVMELGRRHLRLPTPAKSGRQTVVPSYNGYLSWLSAGGL